MSPVTLMALCNLDKRGCQMYLSRNSFVSQPTTDLSLNWSAPSSFVIWNILTESLYSVCTVCIESCIQANMSMETWLLEIKTISVWCCVNSAMALFIQKHTIWINIVVALCGKEVNQFLHSVNGTRENLKNKIHMLLVDFLNYSGAEDGLSGYYGTAIPEAVEWFRPHTTESCQFAQSMGEVVIMPPVGIHGRWSEYNPYSSPLTA